MSNRVLREMDRGGVQRITSTEERLNRLNQNVWNGAVRSVAASNYSEVPDNPTTISDLEVTRGRWMVFVRAHLTVLDLVGIEVFNLRLWSTQGTTAMLPLWQWRALGLMGRVELPVADFGTFETEELATIQVQVWEVATSGVTWSGVRVFALPV
jgi:hypothetical protein